MEYNIDITKEHCPMTMVKVKLKLASLKKGDILNVLLTEGEPLENIPRTSKEQGFIVKSVQPKGDFHEVVIEV